MIAATEQVPIRHFRVNYRGTGDQQYHPNMMPALLIYCKKGIEVLVSVHSESKQHTRQYDFRPQNKDKSKETKSPRIKRMAGKMSTDEAMRLYKRRKQRVESAFGIIKQAMGFRQSLFGRIDKV